MSAHLVDDYNGRVDNCRLGGAPDRGQLQKECCEVEEVSVQSLIAGMLDGIVSRMTLSGVCAMVRLALGVGYVHARRGSGSITRSGQKSVGKRKSA